MKSKLKERWARINEEAHEEPGAALIAASFAMLIVAGLLANAIDLLPFSEPVVKGLDDLLMAAGIVLVMRIAVVLDPAAGPFVKPGLGRFALFALSGASFLGLVALAVHYGLGDPLVEEALARALPALTAFTAAVLASTLLLLRDRPRPIGGMLVAIAAALLVGLGLGHESLVDLILRFAVWGAAGAGALLVLRYAPIAPGHSAGTALSTTSDPLGAELATSPDGHGR